MSNRWQRLSKEQAQKDYSYVSKGFNFSSAAMDVIREAMTQAADRVLPYTRGYYYTPRFTREEDMNDLKPEQPALLSEQKGWAIYTNAQNNRNGLEANMLVHLACNRHWPNWWLAPQVVGGAANDPEIECTGCSEKLPLDAYHVFWGAHRLLNMKRHASRQ